MKRKLLILCACLFGAIIGVKAWTNQSPSAGNTYYLYHPGQNQFLFVGLDDKYGVTPSVFNATPIYAEVGTPGERNWKFSFEIKGVKYYMYQHDGDADIKTNINEASEFEPKLNGDKYRLQTQRKQPTLSPVNYRCLHAGTSGGQCSFEQYNSSSNDGYEWQFISESEVESARNEMAESCASTAANYATTSNGWERVTSVSDLHTNPENYFFAFFSANAAGLMLQATSNNAESQKLYYKTAVNPASGSQYLFEMENHESGGFALKSCAIGKYFSNATSWDFNANQTSATSDNFTNLTLTLANGAYTIQTANSTVNYVGLWTLITDWYSRDKHLAGNKQSSLAGSFLIYRIPKQRLRNVDFTQCITNPSFETGNKNGWTDDSGTPNMDIQTNKELVGMDGDYYIEKYWENIALDLNQTIQTLPVGYYRIAARALAHDGNSIVLYAKAGDNDEVTQSVTSVNDYYVDVCLSTPGSIKLGLKGSHTSTKWVAADNFRLTYLGGMEDLTPVIGKMNDDVNTAQQNAIDTYNSNKTIANYIAAQDAIANAEASIAAYANAASYLEKVEQLLATTNFYTTAAYNSVYGTYKTAYDNNTLEDATAASLLYKVAGSGGTARYDANTANDLLIPGWTIGGNDATTSGSGFYINTWSTESEGSGDAADFANPFYEYWVDNGSLSATVLAGTKTGLTPNKLYRVTANVRIQGTANSGKIKMQVGTGGEIDVTKGNQIGSTSRYIKDYVAVGKTDADGNLTLKFTVESESGISWLSFRDVMYAEQDDDFTYIIKEADCTSQEYWPGNGRTTATGEHYSGDASRVYFTFTSGEDRHQDVTFPATGKYLLKTAVRCKVANTVATMSVGDASATTNFASSKNCYVIGTDGSETTTVNSDGGNWVYNELYFDANAGDVKTITIHLTSKDNVGETDCGGMTLTYLGTEGTLVGMEVSAVAKAGTFVAPFDVVIPARTTAYTVKNIGSGYINLEEKAAAGETLQANTPVILYAEDGIASKISKQFYGTATGSENENGDGSLVGMYSTGTIVANEQNYVMQYNSSESKAEFRQVTTADFPATPYRCYLTLVSSNQSRMVIMFDDDDVTAIGTLEEAKAEAAQKDGKYLVKGRIVLVKNGNVFDVNGQKLN